jgi:ATP-dependent helicase/nuclease subunit B
LQIPSGRAALVAQAERLAGGSARRKMPPSQRPTLVQRQAKLAWPLLARMGQVLDQLPHGATLSKWADAITELADAIGLLQPAVPQDAGLPSACDDRVAWQQLIAALRASETLSRWLGRRPAELSRRQFVEHLEEVLRCESMPLSHDEVGRVRVLSAESARNLSAPYVFVAGLSEKAFPPPECEDCITSEAETRQLVSAGLPLVPQAERRGQEMLLFYEIVTRAKRRLILSYPALDAAAQPLSPSPYLSEIERAFEPLGIERHEQPLLGGVPTTDEVLCPRDFRVRSVAQALSGDGALMARLRQHPSTAPAAANLFAGLQASCARQRGEAFGPFEGMLDSEPAQRVLRARFGPEHCWSPSQLEQYALCPYQFFLDRVLGLEPIQDPVLAVDHAGRGRMLHWLLSALHRGLNERSQSRISPNDRTQREFMDDISVLVADLLDAMHGDRPLANGLLEIDVRRLSVWLADYRRQHDKYDAAWQGWDAPPRPAHFEVSFGRRHGDDADASDAPLDEIDPLSTREAFELTCGDQTIRFGGRIDRIDIGTIAGQMVFNIVDYKSSASDRKKAKAMADGYALQLPLYALAAQQLLAEQQALPFRAAYWHVAGQGYKEAIEFHTDVDGQLKISPRWESQSAELRVRVRSLVAGIRKGQFPMASADDECTSHCAFNTVCRVNQVRALGKQWQAPVDEPPLDEPPREEPK